MRRRRFEECRRVVDANPFERTDAPSDAPVAVTPFEVVDIAKASDQIVLGTTTGAVMARLPIGLTLRPPGDEVELVDQDVADEVLAPRVARQQPVEHPSDVLIACARETTVLVGGFGPVTVAHRFAVEAIDTATVSV